RPDLGSALRLVGSRDARCPARRTELPAPGRRGAGASGTLDIGWVGLPRCRPRARLPQGQRTCALRRGDGHRGAQRVCALEPNGGHHPRARVGACRGVDGRPGWPLGRRRTRAAVRERAGRQGCRASQCTRGRRSMTVPGAETSLTAGAMPIEPSATEEPPPTPFPSAPIEEMLRVLVKGVRAHQLYLHNNPTYLRALEALRAAFPPIWEYTDDFALQITESEFIWEGVAVLSEPGKTADSLPWLFYKDGVRELR